MKLAIARMAVLIAVLPAALAAFRHLTGNSLVVDWRLPGSRAASWLSVNLLPLDKSSHRAELDGGWVFHGPRLSILSDLLSSLGIPGDERTITLHLSDTLTLSKTDLPQTRASAHIAQHTAIGRQAVSTISASAEASHKRYKASW